MLHLLGSAAAGTWGSFDKHQVIWLRITTYFAFRHHGWAQGCTHHMAISSLLFLCGLTYCPLDAAVGSFHVGGRLGLGLPACRPCAQVDLI
jgi:hypothetical protein